LKLKYNPMKKNNLQNKFFEELRKVPIIQVACEKTGVSRNSIYRWKKEDPEFSKEMDQAISDGVAFVNDMSESQLLTMIKEKNWSAISFWLRHRNDHYKDKVEITSKEESESLTPTQVLIVRKALELAAILPNNNREYDNRTNDDPGGSSDSDDRGSKDTSSNN